MKLKLPRGKDVFFTSDEHFGHKNIIEYCARPYDDVVQMDEDLISKFNEVVPKNGFTIHGGDFCLGHKTEMVKKKYIDQLNGQHFFVNGSHDKWLDGHKSHEMIEFRVDGQLYVVCHYAMRVWPASHYNSFLLYGHSHGGLPSEGKSYDVGVDNNWYYPVSLEQVNTIMSGLPDNFNLVKDRRY